jgi:ANTAR domain
MTERARDRSGATEAASLDDVAYEADRLADERERLADERERLADEQERLADERERLADSNEHTIDRLTIDIDDAAEWAHDQVLRAEARVGRALAEQERARATLERVALRQERARAAPARRQSDASARALEDDELEWARERRDFVAVEREVLADGREAQAEARDERAREREEEADERDRAQRRREELAVQQRGGRAVVALGLDKPTERARRELGALREAGQRQRAAAAEGRRRAADARAEAGRSRLATGSGRDPYGEHLVSQFTALTRELFVSSDLFAVAERVAGLSLECIPGVVASGVTFFAGVRPMAQIATDDIAQQLDAYQIAGESGPIATSLETGEPVTVGDLPADTRWPSLGAMAAELGVAGVAACGLTVRRGAEWQHLGAFTVYAESPGAFDGDVGDAVSLFAAHLTVIAALDRDRHDLSRREAALHRALGSRDVIGQAKGILMERRRIPAGEAFDMLRRASQQLNIRLEQVATRLAETGELAE